MYMRVCVQVAERQDAQVLVMALVLGSDEIAESIHCLTMGKHTRHDVALTQEYLAAKLAKKP